MVSLALLFLRLGATAFGGPAAHLAMMEDEVVRRRGWMTRERFLELLGATHLIPGPNSTEMALHIGFERAGVPGLLVAGSCFIVPAALLTGALGWAQVRYGRLPDVAWILQGVRPAVVAVIVQALLGFAKEALRPTWRALVTAGALLATALGMNELLILLGAALIALPAPRAPRAGAASAALLAGGVGAGAAATASVPFTLGGLFWALVKIGSVLFGSGYVLLAFLRAELVQGRGWLTEAQLLDAVTVGQVTPGPVFTTATYVGYVLGGPAGAAVATAGIFLPAFFFVAVSGPLLPRLRRSAAANRVLQGVTSASLALMAWVTWQLARATFVDPLSPFLALLAFGLLVRYRVNASWLVLGSGLIGWLARKALTG